MKRVTNRRQVREVAVQTIYQMLDAEDRFSKESALEYALEAGHFPDEGYEAVDDDYLFELIQGVYDHQEELDQKIMKYLKEWRIERLAKIDLAILRLAFYELFYIDDEVVPPLSVVNEAVELCKFFSDDKSRQFVNGVLDSAVKELKLNDLD